MAQLLHLIVALTVGVLANQAYADEPERIVGGLIAGIGEFPYQVSLRYLGKHLCGGSIIGKKYILTAAHCVVDLSSPPYTALTVVTGSNSLMGGGETHKVKSVVIHSQYKEGQAYSWRNDIALVTLKKELVENSVQKVIPLTNKPISPGLKGVLSGWGKISARGQISVNLLKASDMSTMTRTECNKYMVNMHLYPGQFCAYNRPRVGGCQGDSGGPLVANGKLIGVISFVYPCGIGLPDVYTDVYHYLDFIEKAKAKS